MSAPTPQHWGRSQKYHARPRHIYALLFEAAGCCYVGQTVDLHQRARQHQRGDWAQDFVLVPLALVQGTEAEAADHEMAWRLAAQRRGWRIYAGPPGVIVDPRRRATWSQRRLARRCRWPIRSRWSRWLAALAARWF